MSDDTILPFSFPAICRKKVPAAYDGGRLTSDGGVMLLGVTDILRARVLAIACGYEDADDLDHLRADPGFKLACGRLHDSGADLCSQPTMSRWENMPSPREVVRLSTAMMASCCGRARPPRGRRYVAICVV